MSDDQGTLPIVVINQPSVDELDNNDKRGQIKPSVGRSHSAPQSQNKFTSFRMGLKSKDSPKHERSSQNLTNHSEIDSHLQTLSDGVISQDQSQTVAAMSSSNQHFSSPMSSTPLCDANHSPSSTKKYYEQTNQLMAGEVKGPDVWLRRDHFVSAGPSENVDSHVHKVGNDDSVFKFPPNSNNNNNSSDSNAKDCCGVSSEDLKTDCPARVKPEVANGNHEESSPKTSSDIQSPVRKSPGRRILRQAQSEILPNEIPRKMSIADMNQKGYVKLEEELVKAQRALELKDEEVDELRGIRERLMKEVSDFTASLFEEVNSQLNEAAIGEQQAKKQLQEANCKIEMLSAEVSALKDLVLTSTPSSPNKHLHPQIDTQPSKKEKIGKPFWKTHRRSTSHHQFTQESREMEEAKQSHSQLKEMDTVVFDEFTRWRLQPIMDFSSHFLSRIQQEDIQPCLNFRNSELADKLWSNVQNNTLSIEPIAGDSSFPRKCCLSETHKLCNYKIRLEGSDEWYSISPMCRNRIAAVCNFFTYIRYIIQGLVKSSEKDMFVEIVKLRHQMAQARLGII